MMESLTSVADLIDLFGGPVAFGRAIGKKPSAVGEMKRSNSIRAIYFEEIVEAARMRNLPGVTYEALAKIQARKSERQTA